MTEFAKLLELAERRNIRVVVIKMPTPAQFRALLPNEPAFDAAMTAAANSRGVGFSNFSAELDEPRFYFDTDHLNRAGVDGIVRSSSEGDPDGAGELSGMGPRTRQGGCCVTASPDDRETAAGRREFSSRARGSANHAARSISGT